MKEAECLAEYQAALDDEEKFFFQKAKVDWISNGDRNTKYFHKVIASKRNINRIMSICPNENGTELQTLNLFSNKLLEEEALIMVSEVHDKEIKDAMFDIGENRAPGPDGFTSAFYKHSWSIVGKDICQAIREFFNTGKLLGELNALITLIPKINNPIKVSDYRPIACCNEG
ncbi:hypothetical protein Tco_1131605 [Tanacetum coccineum]